MYVFLFLFQVSQFSLSNYRAHTVQSFIQSLTTIVETALHGVYCPLGGIVMLGGLWYKVFQQHSHRVKISRWRSSILLEIILVAMG